MSNPVELNACGQEAGRSAVYYDGGCPLCSAEIAHYKARPGAGTIEWIDVSRTGEPAPDLTREAALARFHVRQADGTLVSGAAGFVHVWQQLEGWRWAARLAAMPGVLGVLEWGYRAFLPVRPLLSGIMRRIKGPSGHA